MLAGAALAMQGGMGHAGATGGTVGVVLLVSEALHLLAAGAWLGGLLPLFVLARIAAAARGIRRVSGASRRSGCAPCC